MINPTEARDGNNDDRTTGRHDTPIFRVGLPLSQPLLVFALVPMELDGADLAADPRAAAGTGIAKGRRTRTALSAWANRRDHRPTGSGSMERLAHDPLGQA